MLHLGLNHKTPRILSALWLTSALWLAGPDPGQAEDAGAVAGQAADFDRVRRVLSDNCFACHGPDSQERKGGPPGSDGLRLDTSEGARADLGGYAAVVPGKPQASEMLRRMTAENANDLMPPPETGKSLDSTELDLIRHWIEQGAVYEEHWSYVPPRRPQPPSVQRTEWPRNPIDNFILARLESEGLSPSPPADDYTMARRAALDLTGLPPRLEEVDAFVEDSGPAAYERYVDGLLHKKSFGEHWARHWLDLARYADSTGYADDPPRTIWAYRDYVIRSLNDNKPFDRFTVEQLAGDLLPEPTEDQRVATAFHRNTLTNNEGGTDDEEYRNVAIVDRVNTTMSVWMGTTMACAQCHDHKYDPLSQEDYFRLFAILNNTADADRRDESPVLELYSAEQKQARRERQQEMEALGRELQTMTPTLAEARDRWIEEFPRQIDWKFRRPQSMKSQAQVAMTLLEDDSIRVARGGKTDTYQIEIPVEQDGAITALRLEALADSALPGNGPGHAEGNFVLTGVSARLTPPEAEPRRGRYVRVELPGKEKFLSLAEVQVFAGGKNVALQGKARQSSTAFDGPAELAIDGNTDGRYDEAKSTTHTERSLDPWWEVDLGGEMPLERVAVWNRTDGGLQKRLDGFRLVILNGQREVVWEAAGDRTPDPQWERSIDRGRVLRWAGAYADYAQPSFESKNLVNKEDPNNLGWAVGGAIGQSHEVALVLGERQTLAAGSRLVVSLEFHSKHEHQTLGRFRLSTTDNGKAGEYARAPGHIRQHLQMPPEDWDEQMRKEVSDYYLTVAQALQPQRDRLAALQKEEQAEEPYTTVPVMRELHGDKRRETFVQLRGSFLNRGQQVSAGLPGAWVGAEANEDEGMNRLTLARWLVAEDNPLTARVLANRLWEAIFGTGLVRTSEEFGAQGEPPSHPELLDWLAVELQESGWDWKHMMKLMVTSATYRQSSRVTPDRWAADPDNRWYARGPRFRLSAEMIRDQALAASGLLSEKLYGPPVNPPQPKLGLSAAFGSGIDWETSRGADRYRRAIYTTWRRSNPYPSMATFDAPNREVCTVRRERSNTPLQALVTLNDPVYVEAAQAWARRVMQAKESPGARMEYGFRLCLIRPPRPEETRALLALLEDSRERLGSSPEQAEALATDPLGALPEEWDAAEAAAWTVVGNALLNLDETLMKP